MREAREEETLGELCLYCQSEICPDDGCSEYKRLKTGKMVLASDVQFEQVKRAKPAKPVTAETLIRVNKAIDALDELLRDPECETFAGNIGSTQKLLNTLRHARFEKCIDAIDWAHVAERLS